MYRTSSKAGPFDYLVVIAVALILLFYGCRWISDQLATASQYRGKIVNLWTVSYRTYEEFDVSVNISSGEAPLIRSWETNEAVYAKLQIGMSCVFAATDITIREATCSAPK